MANFYWVAFYSDGTHLDQRNKQYTYADIDRDRLIAFSLYSPDDRNICTVDFDIDNLNGNGNLSPKRLVYRRRTMINLRDEQISVHLIGWQRTVYGHNIQSICYVNEENETVVLGGQWVHNRPFMHPIQPYEFERDLVEVD